MYSPLEHFTIIKMGGIHSPLFGFDFSLTNNSLLLLFSVLFLIVLLFNNNTYLGSYLVPSKIEILGLSLYTSVLQMTKNSLANQAMLPVILSLFGTILVSNLFGNIPYTYSVASALSFSIGLSVTVFVGATSLAIFNKQQYWLATFVPANTPLLLLPVLILIELLSYAARLVSLGVRLFANIVAGHTLVTIISNMSVKILFSSIFGIVILVVPVALLVVLTGLELAVALIQAYVFTILTCIYFNEANSSLA